MNEDCWPRERPGAAPLPAVSLVWAVAPLERKKERKRTTPGRDVAPLVFWRSFVIVFLCSRRERDNPHQLRRAFSQRLALPNDLSTTSPARASGSASLFLRTAREADVHLNTYTDVRRRRRCSFVLPDRRRSLVVPHGAYVGELTCTACV